MISVNGGYGGVIELGTVVVGSFPENFAVHIARIGHGVFAAGEESSDFRTVLELQVNDIKAAILQSEDLFPMKPGAFGMRQAYVRVFGKDNRCLMTRALMSIEPAADWNRVMLHLQAES